MRPAPTSTEDATQEAHRRRRVPAGAIALLLLHAGILITTLRSNFITVDEVGHVVAGLSYWQTGRFSLYTVNPPITKLLAVLPVLAAGPEGDLEPFRDRPGVRGEWAAGPVFVAANGPRVLDLVRLARWAGVAWSLAGGWLIFVWARRLHGDRGGLLALAIWCVEPMVLGHAPLVTADVPCAVAALAATYAFVRYLEAPGWLRAIGVGTALGLAQLVKFTLLSLDVLWPLLWLADRRRRSSRGEAVEPLPRSAARLLVLFIASLYTINFGYGFQGSLTPLGRYTFTSRAFTGLSGDSPDDGSWKGPGNRFRGTALESLPVPLPEDLLLGIDLQRRDFEARWRSYLGGQWRNEGWWYYYLYGLEVKLPLGTIALLAWGVGATIVSGSRSSRSSLDDLALLASSGFLLAVVSSQTGFSHHVRYALVALPFLMVNAGRLAAGPPRWRPWAAWTLWLAAAASSLSAVPHSLSYFNEAAGGPERGGEHLLDSNIDWGQDLTHLKRWLDRHPEAGTIGLAYFNVIDPGLFGIRYDLPPIADPGAGGTSGPAPVPQGLRPGYYAVSVNLLHGLEFNVHDGRGQTRFLGRDAVTYFRRFRPIARAGYSIFIYKITEAEATAP